MIFIVYAEVKAPSISLSLGVPEYSYYFVMKRFLPMLKKIGKVVEVDSVNPKVDCIYKLAKFSGEQCLFLSFTPPHKTFNNLECPTIPVFAWEYSTIPSESWAGDDRNNWANELKKYPFAITHSEDTCRATKNATSVSYPIASIPAPLWNDFVNHDKADITPYLTDAKTITVDGWVVDTKYFGADDTACESIESFSVVGKVEIKLTGVVYTSVFNPNDSRKNWQDLLDGFCITFSKVEDATLILKLTHTDPVFCYQEFAKELPRLMPFACRVILIQGFLADSVYTSLIQATSYVVNSAHGEGQCLPLMEFMSAGKPSVAPDHTGMADYVNDKNSFVIDSSDEWFHWPHDPRLLLKTFRKRINWQSLCEGYMSSYHEAKFSPENYAARSKRAIKDLERHCSLEVCEQKMRSILASYYEENNINESIGFVKKSRLGAVILFLTLPMTKIPISYRYIYIRVLKRLVHTLRECFGKK